MGEIIIHPPVKLIAGITFSKEVDLKKLGQLLEKEFSAIERKSDVYDFSAFTDYYLKEMGENLLKQFWVFARLIDPVELPKIKISSNKFEQLFLSGKKRTVNIDPGYISEAKLILATTKNYSHRIYLSEGIFGDIHLQYTSRTFQAQPWTYPDYQQEKVIDFFNSVRLKYFHQLGESFISTLEK